MRLTAFTDYSLRVLIFLAAEPARRATIAQVAGVFSVSENHLTKVVHFLGKQGWLANVRGKGGGVELAMDAKRIVKVCRLRGVLQEAVDAFYAALDRYTLADLVRNRCALAEVFELIPHSAT